MTALAKSRAYGDRKGDRPRPQDILAALRRAPAGMRLRDRVGRYVECVPWREKGRGWDGCDCWGLACLAYREELGIVLPGHEDAYDSALLSRAAGVPELGVLAATIARLKGDAWREIAFDEAHLLDILLLPIAGEPCHVALYVGDLHILHIEEGCNAVCENLREGRWHGRLRHARLFRHRGKS